MGLLWTLFLFSLTFLEDEADEDALPFLLLDDGPRVECEFKERERDLAYSASVWVWWDFGEDFFGLKEEDEAAGWC